MSPSFRSRFSEAIYNAFRFGGDSLSSFKKQYATLRTDFDRSCVQDTVDPETTHFALAVSSRIDHISRSAEEFDASCGEINARFMDSLDKFQRHLEAVSTSREPTSTRRDTSVAARWLSQNFYNPYPPAAVRDDISRQCRWNRKDVDAWFTEARRRIGFSAIRRRFFENKRAAAVEQATKFFNGQSDAVDPALAQAYVDMENQVRELYTNSFTPSMLTVTLGGTDALIPPLTDDLGPPLPISPSTSPVQVLSKRRRAIDESSIVVDRPQKQARQDCASDEAVQLPSPTAPQPESSRSTPETISLKGTPRSAECQGSPLSPPRKSKQKRSAYDVQATEEQTFSAATSSPACPLHSPLPTVFVPSYLGSGTLQESLSPASQTLPSSVLFGDEMNSLHDLSGQADILQFPVKPPEAVSCNNSVNVQVIDMELSSTNVCSDPSNFGSTTCYPDVALSTLRLMNDEYASHSSLFNTFYDDQLITSLCSSSFNQGISAVPSLQGDLLESFDEADVSLNLFSDNPFPELGLISNETWLSNLSHHDTVPPMEESDKANHLAQLEIEMLKQQKNYLQERILILEEQISAPA